MSNLEKKRPALLAFFWLCCAFVLTSCSRASPKVISFSGPTMGTQYNVTIVIPSKSKSVIPNKSKISAAVTEALHQVNQQMSTYIADSELSLLNKGKYNQWISVSKPLYDVLALSKVISAQSNGAFDVTIAPLVNLWGFGPLFTADRIPAKSDIEASLINVGSDLWDLDSLTQRVYKKSPVKIDLSAIAKGFGVDKVAAILDGFGLHNYLVEIGGEVRVAGLNSTNSKWRIGIETPISSLQRKVQKIISISDIAMATSGSYRNYFENDGVVYSHTLDPRTGYPVKHELVSVTVLAENCAHADALATAFQVMGYEKGLKLANAESISALFIIKDFDSSTQANSFKEVASQSFVNNVL